mmetsp:Transcript_18073/g.68534  ORF Transcript_18073/g.68534 Transcript_18073/m.68534 type:complete len:286 (-) Transcript_18073:67-924(-)
MPGLACQGGCEPREARKADAKGPHGGQSLLEHCPKHLRLLGWTASRFSRRRRQSQKGCRLRGGSCRGHLALLVATDLRACFHPPDGHHPIEEDNRQEREKHGDGEEARRGMRRARRRIRKDRFGGRPQHQDADARFAFPDLHMGGEVSFQLHFAGQAIHARLEDRIAGRRAHLRSNKKSKEALAMAGAPVGVLVGNDEALVHDGHQQQGRRQESPRHLKPHCRLRFGRKQHISHGTHEQSTHVHRRSDVLDLVAHEDPLEEVHGADEAQPGQNGGGATDLKSETF